jgi:hypothetical protein
MNEWNVYNSKSNLDRKNKIMNQIKNRGNNVTLTNIAKKRKKKR